MALVSLARETTVCRWADDLGVETLNLSVPLPEADANNPRIPRASTRRARVPEDAEDRYYYENVASEGGIFARKGGSLSGGAGGPRTIGWRLLEDRHVVELRVLDVTTTSDANVYRRVRIASPIPIYVNCLAVSESGDKLVLDFIVECGLLYTQAFDFSVFVAGSGIRLVDANARTWRSIKYPVNFDARRPHLMRAISAGLLVVGLADGDFMSLSRAEPLGDIESGKFHDSSAGLSIGRLLPWGGGHERVPGHPDLSVRAIVDVAAIDGHLLTVSVNRELRVWSLETQALVSSQQLASGLLPDPAPGRYISVVEGEPNGSGPKYVAVFVPCGEEARIDLWQTAGGIIERTDCSLTVPLPSSDGTAWFLCDMSAVSRSNGQQIELTAVWKSGLSSEIRQAVLDVPRQGAGWTWPQWTAVTAAGQAAGAVASLGSLFQRDESKHRLAKLFGPAGYSLRTIETALAIYYKKCGVLTPWDDAEDADLSLKEKVCRVVGSGVSLVGDDMIVGLSGKPDFDGYERELTNQWDRFDRLCAELEKQGRELLRLAYDPHTDTYVALKAAFVSVVRPATLAEALYSNRSVAPARDTVDRITDAYAEVPDANICGDLLRLAQLAVSLGSDLEEQFRSELALSIEEDSLAELYVSPEERLLEQHYRVVNSRLVSQERLGFAVTELDGLDTDRALDVLYRYLVTDARGGAEAAAGWTGRLTHFGAQAANKVLYEYASCARLLVLDLVLVVLVSVLDDQIQERNLYYERLCRLFRSLSGLVVLQSEFNGSDVRHDTADRDDSVVEELEKLDLAVEKTPTPAPAPVQGPPAPGLFIETTLLASLDAPARLTASAWPRFVLDIARRLDLTEPAEASWVASELFFAGFGKSPDLRELFQTYVPAGFFPDFVKGCVLLAAGEHYKALALLRAASAGLSSQTADTPIRCVDIARRISPAFTEDAFGNGPGPYFVACARFAAGLSCYATALALAKDAAMFVRAGDNDAAIAVHTTLADAAVRARSFDDAYQSITELDLAGAPDATLDRAIEHLIVRMCAAGQGLRFCKLPFLGLADRVARILDQAASGTTTTTTTPTPPVDFHRILYAWHVERGDFSSASAALYNQLQFRKAATYKHHQHELHPEFISITQLYMTALNALKCIADERDRWIVVDKIDDHRAPSPTSPTAADPKRLKLDGDLFGHSSGYRVKRTALSYKDVHNEYKDFVAQMQQQLKSLA